MLSEVIFGYCNLGSCVLTHVTADNPVHRVYGIRLQILQTDGGVVELTS